MLLLVLPRRHHYENKTRLERAYRFSVLRKVSLRRPAAILKTLFNGSPRASKSSFSGRGGAFQSRVLTIQNWTFEWRSMNKLHNQYVRGAGLCGIYFDVPATALGTVWRA